MDEEFVRLAIESDGIPWIKHVKTGKVYRLKEIIKFKQGDEWIDIAIYSNISGTFSRKLDNFGGFKYLHNEVMHVPGPAR